MFVEYRCLRIQQVAFVFDSYCSVMTQRTILIMRFKQAQNVREKQCLENGVLS
jgi:hypothetical protein